MDDSSIKDLQPKWSIDSMTISDSSVFIFGWLFVPGQIIERLSLLLLSSNDDVISRINLDALKARHDVLACFPGNPESLESGFVGAGTWTRQPNHEDRIILRATLSDGGNVDIEIDSSRWPSRFGASKNHRYQSMLALWVYYIRRATFLVISGDFSLLGEKLRRHLSQLAQKVLPASRVISHLKQLGISTSSEMHFIVDHQLGGGANQYRQDVVDAIVKQGKVALILTYQLARLRPILTVQTTDNIQHFALDRLSELGPALSKLKIATITYNTGVSFVEPECIPNLLLNLAKQHRARLTVLIHDYFTVCPSHFLLNNEDRFCGIPDLKTCQACLPRNANGFTSLFSGDIAAWRLSWGPLLQQADEIVAFSNSSVRLIRQAYELWPNGKDWLKGRAITVRPHKVDYLIQSDFSVRQVDSLIIGVIGHITLHKGSRFIQRLGQCIEEQAGKELIAIIGSLEGNINSHIIKQTGPYKRERLGDAIHASGANIILFPSICPETFSYVTHEVIELGIPLACFDYGAPAEKVANYEKGLVLKSEDPIEVLQGLRQLFQAAYPPTTSTDA